jgi:hypothetical protein
MGDELTLPLAFMTGLAGAGHCWTMCGGLVGGLFVGRGCAGGACQSGGAMLQPHLGYHAGRDAGLHTARRTGGGHRSGHRADRRGRLGAGGVVCRSRTGRGAGGGVDVDAQAGRIGLRFGSSNANADHGAPLVEVWRCRLPQRSDALRVGVLADAEGCHRAVCRYRAAWLFVFGLGTVPAMALAAGLAQWLGAQALVWLRRAAGLLVIGLGLQAIWAGYKFFQVMLHL